MKKLSALDYVPILFYARREKASGKWVADVINQLTPTEDILKILFCLKKVGFVSFKSHDSFKRFAFADVYISNINIHI